MARPSNRAQKRRDLAEAFERALATHGLGGATIAAVADEADVAPGLIHHHFENREDLARELVRSLMTRFRSQLPASARPRVLIEAYIDAALALRSPAGRTSARAWVGLFAEAIRSKSVALLLQQMLRRELAVLEDNFRKLGASSAQAERLAAGVVASILGCLVFGALMPGKATGFAAPFVRAVVRSQLSD